MIHMILLNLYKKLNKISYIFIGISLIIISVLGYYNANFKIKNVEIKLNFDFYTANYITEMLEIITFIILFFIILLCLMETLQNTNNFDCYFITVKSRLSVIISKIINYLIIIFFYMLNVYIIVSLIALIRFKNTLIITYLFKIFFYHLFEVYSIFLLTFLLVILTNNSFSILLTIAIYILLKIDLPDKIAKVVKYLFLEPAVSPFNHLVSLDIKTPFIILYYSLLIISIITIYLFKDIKC